jgi:hypothetical protein
MSFIYNALVIADITALKNLTSTSTPKLVDGLFLAVANNGSGYPAWYRFKQSATDTENLPKIIAPSNNTGRWFQFNGNMSSGISDSGSSLIGQLICQNDCPTGCGKVFNFFAPVGNLSLQIVPSANIDITVGSDAIQLHKWSQRPVQNDPTTGRLFVGDLSEIGGTLPVIITEEHRWISIYARNPNNSNYHDCVCIDVFDSKIFLLNF